MTPRLVLVGPMGSGKTAVGALVAAELGLGLRDTDTDVEAAAGRTVVEVFADDGEAAFRALERAAVAAALRGPTAHDGVLSLGGGAVMDPATRADLRVATAGGTAVVRLLATWEHVSRRVGDAVTRPLLADPATAGQRWAALAAAREEHYAEAADHAVDTDGRSAPEVAAVVLALLRR